MRRVTYRALLTGTNAVVASRTAGMMAVLRRCCSSTPSGEARDYAVAATSAPTSPVAAAAPSPPTRTLHKTTPSPRSPAPPRVARPMGGRGPMKDRLPPVPTDLADPRRRLAVLIDGSNLNLIPSGCTSVEQIRRTSALFSTVLPAVLQVGVPVLMRVFAHQLPPVWEPLMAGNAAGGPVSLVPLPEVASNGPTSEPPPATDLLPQQPVLQVEYFRVERFIPLAMQIEADARHLFEFRGFNKVEGVCYVCHEVDRAMYLSLMEEQRTGSAELEELLRGGQQREGLPAAEGCPTPTAAAFFQQYVLDELGMVSGCGDDGRSKDGA